MMDTLAPTKEQLQRAEYAAPERSRTRNQSAYTRLNPFERLRARDELDAHQVKASDKFAVHYWGSLGYDVSHEEGGAVPHEFLEYPQTYHGQKVTLAKAAIVLPVLFQAIVSQVEETMTLDVLGAHLKPGINKREIRRNVAVTTISTALDLLAYHWGFKNK